MTAQEIINRLELVPHPEEGGYYRETYRATEKVQNEALPGRYRSPKSFCTAIYYLLTPDSCSRLHRLRSDEIYHFYLGDPVVMLLLFPDGKSQEIILGPDIRNEQQLQIVVPKDTWQGSILQRGSRYALMGTTVAPGFDPVDYELGQREALVRQFPERRDEIIRLTPDR